MRKASSLLVGAMLFCACAAPGEEEDAETLDAPLLAPLPAAAIDVTAVRVTNVQGKAPVKGDVLRITLTVKNRSATDGSVALTPLTTSARFSDFKDVPLGTGKADLKGNETKEITFDAGPFIEKGADKYALGRSDYTITSVRIGETGSQKDTTFSGKSFKLAASRVVFVAVGYDNQYLKKLNYLGDIDAYLHETFTRYAEVFTPKSAGSDEGTFKGYEGGFDQMMNIRQMFRAFPSLDLKDSGDAYKNCQQVGAFAQRTLGLGRNWTADRNPGTDSDHHGFDMMVGLVSESIGGIACTGESLQYSGLFDSDLSIGRSQMIVAHETSHLAGAPHCNPITGYMMCGGEMHRRFVEAGSFVWHKISIDKMKDRWD